MDKKKVIVVCAFPKSNRKIYGGIATSCKLLESFFADKEIEFLKIDSTQRSNPAPNIAIRAIFSIKRIIFFIYLILLKNPSSILLFFSSGPSSFEKGLMILIAKIFKKKTFIFPRGGRLIGYVDSFNKRFNLLRWLLSKSDYFLAQGNEWRNFAKDSLNFSEDNIFTVPNWTATEEMLSLGLIKDSFDFNGQINILYMGWIEKEKGLLDLITAFKKISSEYNVKLSLVGDGSYKASLHEYIKREKINNVFFHGWAENEKKITFLNEADIFVLPSWVEGLPNVLIEAMAMKVPCISTPVGNLNSYFESMKDLVFVDVKDPNAIEDALATLINNIDLRVKIANSSYFKVEKIFSTKRGLNNLYRILLKLS